MSSGEISGAPCCWRSTWATASGATRATLGRRRVRRGGSCIHLRRWCQPGPALFTDNAFFWVLWSSYHSYQISSHVTTLTSYHYTILAQLCNPTVKGSSKVQDCSVFSGRALSCCQSPAPEIETQQIRCWELIHVILYISVSLCSQVDFIFGGYDHGLDDETHNNSHDHDHMFVGNYDAQKGSERTVSKLVALIV
jgi:hypothetical protein